MKVVVGAGAAGIAAARRLHDSGQHVLLVEAADHVGGRARSLRLGGHIVDAGCGWLHSARRNPWVRIARDEGFAIDRSSPQWDVQWRDLGFSPDEQNAFAGARRRFEEHARTLAGGPDRPLVDAVRDPAWRPLLDAISGYANGASLSHVSLHDWLAYEDHAEPENWALPAGFGALVARHAAGVPTKLGCVAHHIDRTGRSLTLSTTHGTIAADAVIVAVPTSALARETIRFTPALPDKHSAAAALPLGLADKVFLRVTGATLPAHTHLVGNPHHSETASHRLFPFGWPLIESFVGGAGAETLAAEGPEAATAFAIGELVALLGSEWRARLTPLATTAWRHAPHVHGSYSHARVGRADQRATLATPVEDRIFFAGEACHSFDFSTAHGAYETGIAAADALMAAQRPR